MIMKKKKHIHLCPLCACAQTRTLSTQAAVHMLEFLEAFTGNLMAQYGSEIHRHYAKRAKRNINVHEPWKGDCTGEPF
jgi:uncharacterized protein YktB (UPF0637 family)